MVFLMYEIVLKKIGNSLLQAAFSKTTGNLNFGISISYLEIWDCQQIFKPCFTYFAPKLWHMFLCGTERGSNAP